MSDKSDADLLAAWRTGDNRAGNELFDRHFESLYRFFVHKVGVQAEDLVQQTLLACLRGGAGWRGDASFRAYLFAIARHELFHHFAKQHKRPEPIDLSVVSIAEIGASPSQFAAARGEDRLLLEGLRRLPLELQIALELYFFEGLRGADLVAALDLPPGTVRSRIRRGLERLKIELEALERAPARLETTMTTLRGWAAAVRDQAERSGEAAERSGEDVERSDEDV